jgi:hypothetical protein
LNERESLIRLELGTVSSFMRPVSGELIRRQ